jgi:hypothetical protein
MQLRTTCGAPPRISLATSSRRQRHGRDRPFNSRSFPRERVVLVGVSAKESKPVHLSSLVLQIFTFAVQLAIACASNYPEASTKRLLLGTYHEGWKMKHQNSGLRKLVAAVALATLESLLVITTSFAQSSENCRAYAEDYSLRYSSPWATSNFNIGGRRAGATALAANRSRAVQQSTLFSSAYARCMRGLWP